jgi:hypothetical protein
MPGSTKNTRLTFKFDGIFNSSKIKDSSAAGYQSNPTGAAPLILADIPESANLTMDERVTKQLEEVTQT